MGKILSQEEIDALLASPAAVQAAAAAARRKSAARSFVTYNFRRPDRVSKEQIRSLHFLHDRFARNITTQLSAYLRTVTDISIVSVEQFAYSEFLLSLPDPTAYYAISLSPFEGLAALELCPAVAFTIIDRMLGGRGAVTPPARGLTEIEQNVIDGVVRLMLENLNELWKPIGGIELRIHARETRPQMLQVSAPNEVIILLVFDIRVGESRGMLNFALPAALIESADASFSQQWRTRKEPSDLDRARLMENLGRVPLSVRAVVDTTMATEELLALEPGDLIVVDRPVSEPIDVQVNGSSKFAARLVRQSRRAALRIESLAAPAFEGAA